MAKTVGGVTTDYVLDGSAGLTTGPAAGLTQVLQETTSGQATSYLYGHDLLAQYDSGTWAYHVNDGLGSVRQLADPVGQVVQSYSFSPFGVPLGESGGGPYGYTGEQWDGEVELLYLRARYYDAQTGRFLTSDSFPGFATKPQTFNAYPYTTNNPATLVDPSGYQGGEAGVLEWSFECLLSNPACQAAAAEAVAIVAVTVEIVGPIVLIAGPPLVLMYLSARYGYWPEPTVQPRPAPAPPGAPPTEEPGTPPAPPPLSPDGTRPMDMRPQPQPVRAPEPPPALQTQPQMDPITYEPCPRETPERRREPRLLMHYTDRKGYTGIIHPGILGPYIMKPSHREWRVPAGIWFTDPWPHPDPQGDELYYRPMIVAEVGIPYPKTEFFILIDSKRLPSSIWITRKWTDRPEWLYVTNVPVDVTKAVKDHGPVSKLNP